MDRRLLAALALLVAGCEPGGTAYPSLAPRAVERQSFAEPATPAVEVRPDPTLDAQVAALARRLEAIAESFAVAADSAERKAAAARGRAAGSDPWLEAQTALAGLDDWRAQASALATDVEALAIARAAALAPAYPAVTRLGERADAEASREAGTITRLQGMLAPA